MLQHLYAFTPQLIIRTPARPFSLAIDERSIEALLTDEQFMEAIYLASPALHAECSKWHSGELTDTRKLARLQSALARYYTRIVSRCTPFGLFAGCSVAAWGLSNYLEIVPDQHCRHTRLDMHYLCALAQRLAERDDLRWALRNFPNTSLHLRGHEWRYVEAQHHLGAGLHQLSAIGASAPLQQVVAIAAQGATGHELASSLLENEEERPEAEAYVQELLRNQVLVSELAPTVTGVEYLEYLQAALATVPAAPARALAQQLAVIQAQLAALDTRHVNTAADYTDLVAAIEPLGVPIELDKLFQTDATHGLTGPDATPATLNKALQATLLDALEILALLAPPSSNQRLANFARRFEARYEEREVSLLEALDTESGLAYAAANSSCYSSLVHDLVLPKPVGPVAAQSPAQQYLGHRLREAERQRHYSIDLTLAELQAEGLEPAGQPLPPSIGVLFRLVDEEQVLVEGAAGSSAVNLLGRFAHATPAIDALIKHVTEYEQHHNPAVAFAEICHLPASRVGNLLQRPHFRALEIPYLAQSTLPAEQQLLVQDLVLRVQDGHLLLYSQKTRQRIIPRLSTAHNFDTPNALPVYQFLCDLQTQGIQANLSASWHGVTAAIGAKFLPRLTCGKAVLAPASWEFTAADLQSLLAATPHEFTTMFARFRAQWQLPRFFVLADGDNELCIDADNELLQRVWLEAVRLQPIILLKEFLFDPAASAVRNAAGQPYVAQGLALMVRQSACYASQPTPIWPGAVESTFALGSEWLYYKLYCGELVADHLLLAVIRPLAAALYEQSLIDNWFFVRYCDPDHHLRVRWHLPTPGRIGEVVQLVADYLRTFSDDHLLWKVQTDTYRRELTRYGSRTIASTEALFGYQSQALLDYMAQLYGTDRHTELWMWGLQASDSLLTAFSYSLPQKLALLQTLQTRFAQEFGLNKALKRQLDTKYRAARPAIEAALADVVPDTHLLTLAQRIQQQAAAGPAEVSLTALLASYLHMLFNRILPTEARLHELVLYGFLLRYYQSVQARLPR